MPKIGFYPLLIRGRHGTEPFLPEAREMVNVKAPCRTRRALARRIEPQVTCQKKVDRVMCNQANTTESHFGQKKQATRNPHVPCLRLLDRAGAPLSPQRADRGWQNISWVVNFLRARSNPLLANYLEPVAQHT